MHECDDPRPGGLAYLQSDEIFRSIFHSTFSFIGLLKPDGTLIEANNTALSMARLTPSDVIGKCFWDCYWWRISPATQETLRQNIERAARGEESVYEVAVWIANRQPITILFSLRPVRDAQGRVIYIVPEGRPIQEQVDARFRYQAILDGTNVGTWEWHIPSGKTRFNERWAEMVGYTLEELAPITIETWVRFAHPQDLERSHSALQACFQGNGEFYEVEVRMRHRDGHWIWVLDRGKVFSWDADGNPLMMYGTHQDISERKHREERLRQSEEAFHNNFRYAGIGMALVGIGGDLLVVNPRLCEFLGYTEKELLQLNFQSITHPEDLEKDLTSLQEVIDGKREYYQIEKRYRHKAGHDVYALLSVSVARDEQGGVRNFISQVVDITVQRQAQEEVAALLALANEQNRQLQDLHKQLEAANAILLEESLTDPLTGLSNRRVMDRILQEQISRVERRASESLGLALVDVDHFKSYNDSFGHSAGDDLLRLLGDVLVSAVRPYDCVARIGGEEFAILLMDTSPEEAARVLERLRASVAQTCWPRRSITISVGFCQWRPGMSQHALFEAADQRLYEAKRRGRNCVVVGSVYSPHGQ